MAAPIRPLPPGSNVVPANGAAGRARSPDAQAAQRAFFAAALGQTPASAPSAPTAQVQRPRAVAEVAAPIQPAQSAAPPQAPVSSGGAPPSRNLRPGSLIDIKV